ncbi:MAG: hypothetical protein SW019_20730 [Actinomycetota bacterium]|nr:hypothetical protein [Actinomycetota bacterium]
MSRHLLALSAGTTALVAATMVVACAHADPGNAAPAAPTAPPQPGAACPADQGGALTALPSQPGDPSNRKNLLECTGETWQAFTGEYPESDMWLSSGPELTLRGQGLRNPEVMAGQWTGTPQQPDGVCSAEFVDVTGGPDKTSEPQTRTGDPGQPLSFEATTRLYTVTLSGFCLWQRS